MDEMGVTHLTDKSGHDVSIRSFGDVFTATRVVDSMHGNRELQCIAIAEVAEIVHAVGSGTEVSLAFLDDGGLENQIMPLSGKFQDSGNVLKFGQDNQVQVLLDSDACNVVDDHPRDIDDAAPKDYEDEPLGIDAADHARGIDVADHPHGIDATPEDEDDGELNTKSEATNIFDSSRGGLRHLVGNRSLPSSTVHQTAQSRSDILAKHRLEYTAHRAALQAGTRLLVFSSSVPVSNLNNAYKMIRINQSRLCVAVQRQRFSLDIENGDKVVIVECSSSTTGWRYDEYNRLVAKDMNSVLGATKCLKWSYSNLSMSTCSTSDRYQKFIRTDDGRYGISRTLVLGVKDCSRPAPIGLPGGPMDEMIVGPQPYFVQPYNYNVTGPCACLQEWDYASKLCIPGPSDNLIKALEVFRDQTRRCEQFGLAIATHIRTDIVPNLELVNDLVDEIHKVTNNLKPIYDKRQLLKKIVKFIPKVGKFIGLVVEKVVAIYLGLVKVKESLNYLTVELGESTYIQLTGSRKGYKAPFTKLDRDVYRLTKLEKFLNDTKTVQSVQYKTGIANQAGYASDAAAASIAAIYSAKQTCATDTVDSFSEKILSEVENLADKSKVCSIIPRALLKLKLGFIQAIYDILQAIGDQFDPLIKTINDVISQIKGAEATCCVSSPQLQAAVQAVSTVVDYATCFAEGPFEGLLNELLKVSK